MPSNDSPTPDGHPSPPERSPRRRVRRRWWLALFLTAAISLPLHPPVWHGILRAWLTHEARQADCQVTITRIEGGLFDTTTVHGLQCRQRHLPAAPTTATGVAAGTDFRIARLDGTIAWRKLFSRRDAATWIGDLTMEGISGRLDLTTSRPAAKPAAAPASGKKEWQAAGFFSGGTQAAVLGTVSERLPSFSDRLLPARFRVACDDLTVRRGRFALRWRGALLTGARGEAGLFSAHEIGIAGPGYENTLSERHAQTYWKGRELTFANLELRPTVVLREFTFNGGRLSRRKLDWQGSLNALGGSVRGQGSLDFSRRRLGLDIGGTLAGVQLRPLAKTIGLGDAPGGQVVQSSFTFRGDLEDWLAGEMWINGSVTDFHWGERRWESLNLRAIVINRHVQVHQFDLHQNGNDLSFNGECVLPSAAKPGGPSPVPGVPPEDWWRQMPFSCNIDARLNQLQALSDLIAPSQLLLSGRMSANGTISARGGMVRGIDGYLNLEGSELSVRGAPLDYLHSTLLFRGGEVQVADVQATHAGDYFFGKGGFDLAGAARYQGEFHAAVKEMAIYAPAYRDIPLLQPISGALDLDWSGAGSDGGADAASTGHRGEFHAVMKRFFTSAGGGAMPRPVNLEAAGGYAPAGLKVDRLTLVDGEGKARHDAIRIEGEIPWMEDVERRAAGQWLDFTRSMNVRARCEDAPLDVLAALVPAYIHAARGRIDGYLEARDTGPVPSLDGALEIKDADFLWTDAGRTPLESVGAVVRVDGRTVHFERCEGKLAGEPFSIRGTVGLHNPAQPALDLALAGRTRLHSDAGRFDASAEYAVRVRNDAANSGSRLLDGEVRLTGGRLQRRIELAEGPISGAFDVAPRDLLKAFTGVVPQDLTPDRLDLHVMTSEENFRFGEAPGEGSLSANLYLRGDVRAPVATGHVSVGSSEVFLLDMKLALVRGTLYFTEDHPADEPVAFIETRTDGSEERTYFFGSRDEGLKTVASGDFGGENRAVSPGSIVLLLPGTPLQNAPLSAGQTGAGVPSPGDETAPAGWLLPLGAADPAAGLFALCRPSLYLRLR